MNESKTIFEGRWLRLRQRGTWEYVERTNPGGAAIIIAVTPDDGVLLVEQFRVPIQSLTLEFPAGLIGDEAAFSSESAGATAQRELEEETGWRASWIEHLHSGPSSAGMSTEVMHFFRAGALSRVSAGGGVAGENIVVHEVPVDEVATFIARKASDGFSVDPKVYAGLFFLHQSASGVRWPSRWWHS